MDKKTRIKDQGANPSLDRHHIHIIYNNLSHYYRDYMIPYLNSLSFSHVNMGCPLMIVEG